MVTNIRYIEFIGRVYNKKSMHPKIIKFALKTSLSRPYSYKDYEILYQFITNLTYISKINFRKKNV